MPSQESDRQFFLPAVSVSEALSRMYSITGAQHQGRGEKRALVALRDALALDVDLVRTNSDMAARLAERLDVQWHADRFTVRHKVNLAGLNTLLEGATEAFYRGELERLQHSSTVSLDGREWLGFVPAVSKIEAVTRIAALTGAPSEFLGPGSKERKSVLTNLADRLLPEVPLDRSSKTRLGRDLASHLAAPWTDSCYSTGETISLEGLNAVLAGSERLLGRLGATTSDMLVSPQAEGEALVAALADGMRWDKWDGRACVRWMDRQEVRGANDNEWQGWFFEARGKDVLNAAFTPRRQPIRTRYGNTAFDYSLNHVWDLKAHSAEQYLPLGQRSLSGSGTLILNDAGAIRACAADQGVGFLVLSGRAWMDEDAEFVTWHRDFKKRRGGTAAASNSGRSRMRKSHFEPQRIDAFWFADEVDLDGALATKALSVRSQGRQAPGREDRSGRPRPDKVHLHVKYADRFCVASHSF